MSVVIIFRNLSKKEVKMRKILVVTILMSLLCATSYAAIPHLINYQGRLTDKDSKPLEGAYTLTFRIYDAETGSGNMTPWEETHSGVVIQKGIFSVLLGSVANLNIPFDKPYFLEIKVGSEVMSPRQRITSAGYAMRTEEAEKLGGKQPTDYALAADITPSPTANKAIKLDASAKLPVGALKVYDSGWFAVTTGNKYTKTHNLGTTKVLITVQFSQNADGSNPVISNIGEINNSQVGAVLSDLTTTQVTYDLSGNPHGWAVYWDGYIIYSSGYMRIVMLALE